MTRINRRTFLAHTSKATLAAITLSNMHASIFTDAGLVKMPIGFQSWSVKDMLGKDLSGTLALMKSMGYQSIEMCSPQGYKDIGFGPLAKLKTSDLRQIISEAGLSCFSCHFGFGELAPDKIDTSISFAKEMGLTQMICSTFWLPGTASLKDYLDASDKLNIAAAKIKNAGMHTGFHNHEFEFHILDGQLIYDALMHQFNPDLVRMQFQTEVINLGFKASDFFEKYPGRFISSHLSDWTKDKNEVPIGQGIIDWQDFFKAARIGGVQNIFVEMSPSTLKESIMFLKELS